MLLAAVPALADTPPANSRYNWFMFGDGISVNFKTGQIRLPPGMHPDRASRLIWDDMARLRGAKLPFPMEKMP